MKQLFWNCLIISFIFFVPACSTKQIESVLDDISRDTYENNARKQRMENFGNPNDEEPLSYDNYQKERKEMLSDPGITETKENN